MRILFISDIHGVPSTLSAALEQGERLGYDRLVLLGDLMYHGPRNGVPGWYDPQKVADLLNARRDQILAVRGNCDWSSKLPPTETVRLGDKTIFITHGHLYQAKFTFANMVYAAREQNADILLFGHTHQAVTDYLDGLYLMNPGSCSGYYATYGTIDITNKGDIVTNIVRLQNR